MISMDATALITGGSGGLGNAVTAEFLDAGWRVVVPWIAEHELERLPAAERLETVRADLFEPASAAEAVDVAAAMAAAPLRAVVNLVGGFAIGGRVHETPVDEFERQVRLNIVPAYTIAHAALPHMITAGTGAVVCVSSRAAVRPFPGAAGYVTGKAAVLALVDALAVEYVKDGIRVNAVMPSVIDTPANRAAQPGADYSSWVAPERIARVVRFLCEGASDAVSGGHIPVYGAA
jgi:NAD(P)-dependent dehydrogenase (short-subunit alcohol dehydrogenase family)